MAPNNTMVREFSVGDVVQLKSGGAKMTVRHICKGVIGVGADGDPLFDLTTTSPDPNYYYVECNWTEDSGANHSECFWGSMLESERKSREEEFFQAVEQAAKTDNPIESLVAMLRAGRAAWLATPDRTDPHTEDWVTKLPKPIDALTGAVLFVDEEGNQQIYIPATMSQVQNMHERLKADVLASKR